MEPCKCPKCLARVKGPETYSAWELSFRKDIETGRIIHVGNKEDGRPIYRAV